MLKTVDIKDIKPNPFNARTDYAKEPIDELAKEIDKVGFWAGSLRGRMNNGKVELCFGHRRLMALKKLGRKDVQVDVIELNDKEMQMQGLIENLQRQGLNDMEKAKGIKNLAEHLTADGTTKKAVYEEIKTMLGYKSASMVQKLIEVTTYPQSVQEAIAKREIAPATADVAMSLGGAAMVQTAIKENLKRADLCEMAQALEKIPDEKIKAKMKAKVISGELTSGEEVEKKAEPMLHAKAKKKEPPPDLMIVIAHWTISIKEWRKALREVIPYRAYFSKAPKIAAEFQEQAKGLIKELKAFLPEQIED